MTRGMRLKEAKAYVAGKLSVSTGDLSDPVVMGDLRSELGLARVVTPEAAYPREANAIEAKFRIAQLLDLPINCVNRFAERTGLARP